MAYEYAYPNSYDELMHRYYGADGGGSYTSVTTTTPPQLETKKHMTKYYKVIKENPQWEVGAILSNENDSDVYEPIEDCWNKYDDEEESILKDTVEKNPDFFVRVYKSKFAKAKYVTADKLKELMSEMTK